jgi:hypothetical protein
MPTSYPNSKGSSADSSIFESSASNAASPAGEVEFCLPVDAEILHLHFSSSETGEADGFRFGNQQQYLARPIKRFSTSTLNLNQILLSDASLNLILIPNHGSESIDLIQGVQAWINSTTPTDFIASGPAKSILLTLQGVHIIWQPQRAVVFADPHRLEQVCQSLIEATYFEQELRRIEAEVDRNWDQTQRDSIFAFEFNEQSLPHKTNLRERFQSVLGLRIALARLTPQILVPHVYPPTIASQIGERLRERTRMPERLTLIDERLDAQERIYDHCAERVSEYVVARKGHILEWVIIILLLAQTLFWIIDFLSSMGE